MVQFPEEATDFLFSEPSIPAMGLTVSSTPGKMRLKHGADESFLITMLRMRGVILPSHTSIAAFTYTTQLAIPTIVVHSVYGAPFMEARRMERDVAILKPRSIIIAYISPSLDKS
jgi:hypothetical protein